MKNVVMPSLVQMNEDELRQLTTEVRETIAKDFEFDRKPERRFSEADLWNIRRSWRPASFRLRRF